MEASDLADILGRVRYGPIGTSGKEALAARGALPGAPVDRTADQTVANRYAAGYLFTQEHPTIAQYAIPAASFIHGLFGDAPEVQSYAQAGMNRALLEVERQRTAAQAAQALLAASAAGGRGW